MVRPGSFRVLALALLLSGALPSVLASAAAGGALSNAVIALHLKPHAVKSIDACTEVSPIDEGTPCSRFVTQGTVGVAYDAFLVVARGDSAAGIAALSCGLAYDHEPGHGVDVLGWSLCADLQFANGGRYGEWPAAGGGNRITWLYTTNCQRSVLPPDGAHAVAGSFYLVAYGPDLFSIVPNSNLQSAPELAVASCSVATDYLPFGRGASVTFSEGGEAAGYNPCEEAPAGFDSCVVAPSVVDFGPVPIGASKVLTVTITNRGQRPLQGGVSESCPQFDVTSGGSYSIAPGDSASVTIRFAPTTMGPASCLLSTTMACPNVVLRGVGEDRSFASCSVAPLSLDFGQVAVGDSLHLSFRLLNLNRGQVFGGVISEDCDAFSIPTGGGRYSLVGGQIRGAVVRFKPPAPGLYSCVVQTGDACLDKIAVTGEGVPAEGMQPQSTSTHVYPMSGPGETTQAVGFDLPETDSVRFQVFDVAGRVVADLPELPAVKGSNILVWNARGVPSGVYFYRLETSTRAATCRVVLVHR